MRIWCHVTCGASVTWKMTPIPPLDSVVSTLMSSKRPVLHSARTSLLIEEASYGWPACAVKLTGSLVPATTTELMMGGVSLATARKLRDSNDSEMAVMLHRVKQPGTRRLKKNLHIVPTDVA